MRKQPKQGRSKMTVDAILEAAARILEDRGLTALNTNLVAERAGVSIGSLYQYFPTKDAIVAELARRERRGLSERLSAIEVQESVLGWPEIQKALIAAAVEHQLARPRLARALEYAEAAVETTEAIARFNQELVERIAGLLAHKGTVPAHMLPLAAHDLVAIVRGMADAAGLRGEEDQESLARRIGWAVSGYLAQ